MFWEFLKVVVISFAAVAVVLLVLLSLPRSRLRGVVLQVVGWSLGAVTALCVLYILNPIDILPDFIPILGQVDDAGALITALFSGVTGVFTVLKGRSDIRALPETHR